MCHLITGDFLSHCRYKASNGELQQITSDVVLRRAVANLEDGFRLTMWAYEIGRASCRERV